MSTDRELLAQAHAMLKNFAGPHNKLLADIDAHLKEPVQDARTPEDELNCAEEVLDGYAAHLPLEQTCFDCIGDYITAVVEATKSATLPQPAEVPSEFELAGYLFEGNDSSGNKWHVYTVERDPNLPQQVPVYRLREPDHGIIDDRAWPL